MSSGTLPNAGTWIQRHASYCWMFANLKMKFKAEKPGRTLHDTLAHSITIINYKSNFICYKWILICLEKLQVFTESEDFKAKHLVCQIVKLSFLVEK